MYTIRTRFSHLSDSSTGKSLTSFIFDDFFGPVLVWKGRIRRSVTNGGYWDDKPKRGVGRHQSTREDMFQI